MTEKYSVNVVGTKPLLLHNPAGLNSDRPHLRRGEHLDPKVEAESYLYKNGSGQVCIPATNIKACIRSAGFNYRVAGRRTTFAAMIRAALEVSPEMVPIVGGGWIVDTRPVVIQRAKILRNRPRFNEWSLQFEVLNNDPTIVHKDTLERIIKDAGLYYGLGDFRPEFGLFKLDLFLEAPKSKARTFN